MKSLSILLLAAFAGLSAHANVPEKAPRVKYTGLWTNSPFTSKPPPPPPGETVNPFEDFMLTGIAPVPGGYRITIVSKKNPDVKKVLEPGVADEFKVVTVNRNPQKSLGTTVVLSSGSIQGTVSFEPELVTIKTAPAAQQPDPNPAVNNPNQPPLPVQAGDAVRQPRPRIVPPAAPAAGQPPQPQIQRGARGENIRRPAGNRR
jgi:hypothetical protein